MDRVIVGTAGHIDHGKTSLIKAVTGVNTDRLKEERERGITIKARAVALSIVYPPDDSKLPDELRRLRHLLPPEVFIVTGGRAARAYDSSLQEIGADGVLADISPLGVAAGALAPIAAEHQLVISHGNGPQVGLLALQASALQGAWYSSGPGSAKGYWMPRPGLPSSSCASVFSGLLGTAARA